jgi:hypothetical protein
MATSTPYQTVISDDQPGMYVMTVPVFAASAIANADELTDFIPGHPFEITGIEFVCVTPITTAAKTALLKPYIDGTVVPGTATAVAGAIAKGVVKTAFVASGAKLYGSATSKIKLTASSVTAFVEGAGYWAVHIRNLGGNAT